MSGIHIQMTAQQSPAPQQTPASQAPGSSNLLLTTFFTGLFTLAGAASTPFFTWLTADQTAATARFNSCVEKIDLKESKLREKGEALLLSLGEFHTTFSDANVELATLKKLTHDLSKAAFSFSAYAPPDLSSTSISLSTSIDSMFTSNEAEQSAAAKEADRLIKQWTKFYYEAGSTFEHERFGCELKTGS